MPAATRSSPRRRRAGLAARQSSATQATPTFTFTPPPFPPFQTLTGGNPNGVAPFPLDPSDPNNLNPPTNSADGLPPGIIAAIVLSVFAFFLLATGAFALLHYRRRKAHRQEIALKEEAASSTAGTPTPSVTLSGALDPPPPYDEVSSMNHHHQVVIPRGEGERERRWDSGSLGTGTGVGTGTGSEMGVEEEEEEDEEMMGSHATITDGLDPGRHGDRG